AVDRGLDAGRRVRSPVPVGRRLHRRADGRTVGNAAHRHQAGVPGRAAVRGNDGQGGHADGGGAALGRVRHAGRDHVVRARGGGRGGRGGGGGGGCPGRGGPGPGGPRPPAPTR